VAGGEREKREGTKSVEEWGEREMGFNTRYVTSRGDHRRSSSRRVIVRRSHLRPRICHDLQFHYFSLIFLGRGKNPSFERARRSVEISRASRIGSRKKSFGFVRSSSCAFHGDPHEKGTFLHIFDTCRELSRGGKTVPA